MFNFLKRNDKKIYSPISGNCVDITEVNDLTFAKKLVGDGVAVVPDTNVVCAPCDGKIVSIFPTKHAFSMKRNDGTNILVHIGIDTVNLNGKGFKRCVKENTFVKKGTPIIEFEKEYLENEQFDMTIMVLFVDSVVTLHKINLNKLVSLEDEIVEYEE